MNSKVLLCFAVVLCGMTLTSANSTNCINGTSNFVNGTTGQFESKKIPKTDKTVDQSEKLRQECYNKLQENYYLAKKSAAAEECFYNAMAAVSSVIDKATVADTTRAGKQQHDDNQRPDNDKELTEEYKRKCKTIVEKFNQCLSKADKDSTPKPSGDEKKD